MKQYRATYESQHPLTPVQLNRLMLADGDSQDNMYHCSQCTFVATRTLIGFRQENYLGRFRKISQVGLQKAQHFQRFPVSSPLAVLSEHTTLATWLLLAVLSKAKEKNSMHHHFTRKPQSQCLQQSVVSTSRQVFLVESMLTQWGHVTHISRGTDFDTALSIE